jgi:ABC-type transport system involved in cytochrome c biogenesis permease component
MSSIPTWAGWSIVVPLILLSPIIALLLTLATEIVIVCLVDVGAPAFVLLGAGVGGLLLLRALRESRRAASSET